MVLSIVIRSSSPTNDRGEKNFQMPRGMGTDDFSAGSRESIWLESCAEVKAHVLPINLRNAFREDSPAIRSPLRRGRCFRNVRTANSPRF